MPRKDYTLLDNETEPDAPKPLTHVELMKCMMPLIDHMTVTNNSAILSKLLSIQNDIAALRPVKQTKISDFWRKS